MRDPLENFYTPSEKTDRKYTIYQAVQSARARLGSRFSSVCTNAIAGRADSERITLQELNKIADHIVRDTKYYS